MKAHSFLYCYQKFSILLLVISLPSVSVNRCRTQACDYRMKNYDKFSDLAKNSWIVMIRIASGDATHYSKNNQYTFIGILNSNGESKSLSKGRIRSLLDNTALDGSIFQSIPRLSSRMDIPPSASG